MRYQGPPQRMQILNQYQPQMQQQQQQQPPPQGNFMNQNMSQQPQNQQQPRQPNNTQMRFSNPAAQQPIPSPQQQNMMAGIGGIQPGLPPVGVSGMNPSAAGNADPEKRKLIQQQLVLLLHAHKCQRREAAQGSGQGMTGDASKICQLPHCKTMKGVLNHMTSCVALKQCTVPHCASSRQIISHWKNCSRPDCPVCLPLKQASDRRQAQQQQQAINGPNANLINSLTQPSPQGMMAGSVGPSSVGSLTQPAITSNGPSSQQPPQQQPPSIQGAYQVLGLPYNNSGSPSPRGPNGTPLGSQVIRPNGPNAAPVQGVSNSPAGGPVKDWHVTVTQDLRNHLIQKIVQAIFPTSDSNAYKDKRMNNLYAYAEKVERDMYDTANSREEYYHLLAEKIYKIQKELEEKRQRRREQQMQQQMQPQPQVLGSNAMGTVSGGIRQPSQPNQASGMMPQRMNLNMPAPPNVTLNVNHMNPVSHTQMMNQQQQQQQQQSNQQYFIPPSTPGHQNRSQAPPNSTPFGANLTLQGMLANQPSQSPSSLIPGLNQGMSSQLQPNTPSQGPPSVASLNSNATPPPPSRPSSVPANKLQQQLMGQSNQQMMSGLHMKQENNVQASGVTLAGLDSDLTLEKLLPVKSEPKDLDEFLLGTSSSSLNNSSANNNNNNNATPHGGQGVKAEITDQQQGVTASSMEVKKEEPDDSMELLGDNSSSGGKGVKEEPDIKPAVTPSESSSSPSSSACDSKSNLSTVVSSSTPTPTSSSSSATSTVRRKKVFNFNEIRHALRPTLEKLLRQDPESLPFRQPVDPILLNIPDYFDIIKTPMDLSTIARKLDDGDYEDPWQYVNDVYLMFDNARLYNRRTSKVYRYCTKLNEIFEQEIDPVMQSLGYCCGRRQVFQPQVLCCFGKQLCTIPRDAKYMSYQNKITYCMKCFSEITTDHVSVDSFGLDPNLTGTTTVLKSQFTELKNDHLDLEPFVECKDCGRSFHTVCVVHMDCVWPEGFVCDGCLKSKRKKRKENRFTAKRLPQSRLGNYIETRVNSFLKKKESGAGEVTIRVVSSSEKTVEVKPGMKQRYDGDWPETFPYKAKALFAFEDFNGVDVCFFGMHVQEYGSDAPQPNSRRVYIAYLDSVHFFKPKQYRTAVYHEILLGYLQYAREQGYAMAHIWACPPSEGDDYIFHCHPPEQKIPKPKRLQDWYKKMLDIGIKENIVHSYQDILKQAQEDQVKTAMDLPYFEGDFWPNVIEESIKEIEMEQQKQQANDPGSLNSSQSSSQGMDEDSMDTSDCGDKTGNGSDSKDSSSGTSQKNQKKSGANKKSNKKQNQRKNNVQRNKSGGQVAGQVSILKRFIMIVGRFIA